ncbi:MAG: hypothetical protein JXR91_14690 [Deltaproteobacteria bacterium]|nr:hypothetical protein [Deltaproteobacteria bacterium]
MMYKKFNLTVLFSIAFALAIYSSNATAQTLVLDGTGGAGTGATFGQGDGKSVVLMSPVFVDVNIIISNTERRFMEYVIGFRAELQKRVTTGIVPAVRFTSAPKKVAVYGLVGLPFIFAPKRLLGVQVGAGMTLKLMDKFGIFFEGVMDMYFFGNDLPKDSTVVQLNGIMGIRVIFK